jgi:type IV pilus assembly protein PilA
MINKNAEINAIEKAQEDIDTQFISNPIVVQSQLEYVAIAPKKKGKYWFLFKLLIYFLCVAQSPSTAKPANPTNINGQLACGGGRESEAEQYVGSMNRAQQAKFAENGAFANSVDALNLGIKTKTTNFHYSVNTTKTAAFGYGIPNKDTSERVYFGPFHWNKKVELRGYVGAVFLVTNNHTKEKLTVAIRCVTKSPTKTQPPNPILDNGNPTCANGTDPVTR